MSSKTYSGMRQIVGYEERFEYLALRGGVANVTFGFERWMNQQFYTSTQWRSLRHEIIVRDNGCDMGVDGYEIHDKIIIHHIIPMTPDDFEVGNPLMLDPNNLICVTHKTHNAIHYGDKTLLSLPVPDRAPGDTTPWK